MRCSEKKERKLKLPAIINSDVEQDFVPINLGIAVSKNPATNENKKPPII